MAEEQTAPAWQDVIDEHGEIIDPSVPAQLVHDEATYKRWLICLDLADQMSGGEAPDSPEVTFLASTIFGLDIPTDDEDQQLQEARIPHPPGQLGFSPNQWRNRLGRWVDMPGHGDDAPHPPSSPGIPEPPKALSLKAGDEVPKPHFTEREIRAAGLDRWPSKGPKAQQILGDAVDTFELFGPEEPDADPKFPEYATDRAAKHDALIADALEGKEPPQDATPHALFMAGGPASGKTTVLRENRAQLAPPEATTVHVDVDAIKAKMADYGMPEYDEMRDADDRYAATAVHREAGDIATRLVQAALDKGLNVIIDGTGNSDPGLFRAQLEEMRDKGYTVDALYVNRPTETSVSLAIKRAEDDKRFVPLPVVRDQHIKVSINYRDEIQQLKWLNSLVVFDAGFGPTAMMDENGEMHILHNDRYAAFVAKADETPPDQRELDKLDGSNPITEAAATDDEEDPEVDEDVDSEETPEGKFPPEKWIPEMPHDSSEYLARRKKPW